MQEGVAGEVAGMAQPRRPSHQLRAAERIHVLGQQQIDAQTWIAAPPIADPDIDVVALEVRQPRIGVDAHFDVGMGASESLEPRHQPLARK
jgi:hypothetical protein